MLRIAMLLLMLCISVMTFALPAQAGKIEQITNNERVRDLYHKVNKTIPSVVNQKGNTEAIKARLACYSQYTSYSQRIQICNNAYVKKILFLARSEIKSRPSLGEFVLNVGMCPVMYNLCVGQTGNNEERCIRFERQCIDYTLDTYWRGAVQYTQ